VVLQTVNVRLCPEQIAYTIDHAGSSTLLVNDEFVDLVHSILPQLSKVKRLVVLTDRKAPATGKLVFIGEYEELLAAASPDFEFADFDENVQATTFYTTGTRGCRKASTTGTASWCCMQSRNSLCSALRRSKASSHRRITDSCSAPHAPPRGRARDALNAKVCQNRDRTPARDWRS
jgi:acyl-CoA synthetase (AMP-forming)/AMP-acid ligase II